MKKLLSAFVAAACLASASVASISVSAEYTTSVKSQDYLSYVIVDEDEDGVKDFVRIVGCTSAESVLIPKTIEDFPVKEITDDAFVMNTSVVTFNVESENQYFKATGGVLFNKNATKLVCYPCAKKTDKSYSIPSTVSVVGNNAFKNCSVLTEVKIAESVTTIGDYAFENCSSLGGITIPSGVTSIGTNAFSGTKLLKDQVINQTGPIYYADKWVIKSDDVSTVMNDSTPIKSGTIGIAGGSFYNHTSLSKIDIPSTVLYIGDEAFLGCSQLSSVTLSSSLKTIGAYAFSDCSSLVELSIPNKVSSMGDGAFLSCDKLAKINIPSGIQIISESLFQDCEALVSIDIPENVSRIEKLAFYNCSSLNKVTIRNKNCVIENKPQTFSNSETTYGGSIVGYAGSTADTYAHTHNRQFEVLGSGTPAGTKGDANGDGKVDVRDAAFIANQLALGKEAALPDAADFNEDGKVNVRDAAAIASYLAKGSK